ncbi:FeoA family protein [Streptococcus sp. DD12]|uniref:FeoA family protein n=1 Tax=Streptococcus sp. DD12 TaxID=1777880 RepID=UPI00079B9975|nr:ferrous iron transport protein A [Streptococcus sp. DD12]KXT75455.1 Ferrous iron transport protein A [Streptococcus sp. DD12]
MQLNQGNIDTAYQVVSVDLPETDKRHLANLGIAIGREVKVVSKTKGSAIIMLRGSRLALDQSILARVGIAPVEETFETLPLSELAVGEHAVVVAIHALAEAKRRLMDMGITRHTQVYLRKVAPLGDPIEINLRGYELTLRKSEAQLISVKRLKETDL